MFFKTINRKKFVAFLKNRADFSLSGTILGDHEPKLFYRFVRMPLAEDLDYETQTHLIVELYSK